MKKVIVALTLSALLAAGSTAVYAQESEERIYVPATDLIDWVTEASQEGQELISPFSLSPYTTDREGAIRALIAAADAGEQTVELEDYYIPVEECRSVFNEFLYRNPRFFWLSGAFSYRYWDGYVTSINFMYSDTCFRENQPLYEAAVAKAISVVEPGMSDLDKALALHDYLAEHNSYDYTYSKYTPYDALVNGSSVCQGYALAFMDLMNRVGINCDYASSDAMNHAWNLIQLGNDWYHVDVTWDDPSNRYNFGHQYFLLSDAGILQREHKDWNIIGNYTADNQKYDASWWRDLNTNIIYMRADDSMSSSIFDTNDLLLFYLNENGLNICPGGAQGNVYSYKLPGHFKWNVWGAQSNWIGMFNNLVEDAGILYYHDSDSVYALNLMQTDHVTGDCLWTYTGGEGYLYHLKSGSDGSLSACVSTGYNPNTFVADAEVMIPDQLVVVQDENTLKSRIYGNGMKQKGFVFLPSDVSGLSLDTQGRDQIAYNDSGNFYTLENVENGTYCAYGIVNGQVYYSDPIQVQ